MFTILLSLAKAMEAAEAEGEADGEILVTMGERGACT